MSALYVCVHVIMLIWIVIICWLLPDLAPPTLPFGVRIPPTRAGEPAIARLRRRYRLAVLVTGLAGLLALLLMALVVPFRWQIWSMTVVPLALVASAGLIYAYMNGRLRRLKKREDWYAGLRQAVAVEIAVPEPPTWPSPFWLGLDLLLLVAFWVLTVVRYPLLPERIPVHFGLNGQVDRWGGKEEVLFFSLFVLALNVLLLGLALALPLGSRQLDPADPEQARRDRQRRQRALRNLMASLLSVVNLSFFLIALLLTQVIPPTNAGVALVIALVLILPVGLGGLIVFYLAQARPARAYALHTNYVARDDDRYWKAGIFYLNRDDPALFVERRFGMGWTVNVGHPLGVVIVVVCLLLVVAALLLPLLLGLR